MAFEMKFSTLIRLLIGGDFYSKKYGISRSSDTANQWSPLITAPQILFSAIQISDN